MNPNDLIGPPLTAEYEHPSSTFVNFLFDPNRPIFTTQAAESMLTDPRVRLGLALRRGPILSNSRFFVHCDNPEAKAYIASQINRFWHNSAPLALRAHHFGYQPAEVIYRMVEGDLQFDRLRHLHPKDCGARTLKGMYVGFDVGQGGTTAQPLFIGCPKAFWSVHNRYQNRWYGQSLLYGAYPPWYEKWTRRGYRDQRQMFFFKYAFRGPIVKYPPGGQPASTDGTPAKDNRHIAHELVDKFASGAGLAIPSSDPTKGPGWDIMDPFSQAVPEGLMEYGRDLDNEIYEGMEIPPEIASGASSDGGGGISIGGGGGRDIPQQAYFSILSEDTYGLMTDLDEQILNPMVKMKFGDVFYEIECFGLLRGQDSQAEPGAFEQSQGEETANLGPDQQGKPPIQMSAEPGTIQINSLKSSRSPIITRYNEREEAALLRHYRRHSEFSFSMRRSA